MIDFGMKIFEEIFRIFKNVDLWNFEDFNKKKVEKIIKIMTKWIKKNDGSSIGPLESFKIRG